MIWDNVRRMLTTRTFDVVVVRKDHGVGDDVTSQPDKVVTYAGEEVVVIEPHYDFSPAPNLISLILQNLLQRHLEQSDLVVRANNGTIGIRERLNEFVQWLFLVECNHQN